MCIIIRVYIRGLEEPVVCSFSSREGAISFAENAANDPTGDIEKITFEEVSNA